MSTASTHGPLYLVGFRIEPDIYDPQLYTIYVYDDRPIMREGSPIVFPRAELAAKALAQTDCGAAELGEAPTELYTVFDVTDAVYTLACRDEAETSQLLDCINALLDFLNCIGEPMPPSYRTSLEALADHLTFDKRFAEFLNDQHLQRRTLLDAFYWAVGAVVCHARVVL